MAQDEPTSIMPIDIPAIHHLIYTMRGKQVMLDSDLAMLYQVETKVLNQTVSRNLKRFPERFRFQLTEQEWDSLRSQFVTSKNPTTRGGRRYLPYVFTEQGVSMLSSVLKSDVAIDVSVRIMDAFVEMRQFIAGNAAMFDQIRAIELRQLEYQKNTDERFERVFAYMETHETPKQKIFFDGQIYDAFALLIQLVQQAKQSICLIDGYVDIKTLNILAKKRAGVAVDIWTHPQTRLTQHDIDTFNAEYPELSVKHTQAFHDRFLILGDTECYLIGASLKDAGKKSFGLAKIEDPEIISNILIRLSSAASS